MVSVSEKFDFPGVKQGKVDCGSDTTEEYIV